MSKKNIWLLVLVQFLGLIFCWWILLAAIFTGMHPITYVFLFLGGFIFCFARGFFTERLIFKARKLPVKASLIIVSSQTLVYVIFILLMLSADVVPLYNFHDYYQWDSIITGAAVLMSIMTFIFGVSIGFFSSKFLASLPKKVRVKGGETA